MVSLLRFMPRANLALSTSTRALARHTPRAALSHKVATCARFHSSFVGSTQVKLNKYRFQITAGIILTTAGAAFALSKYFETPKKEAFSLDIPNVETPFPLYMRKLANNLKQLILDPQPNLEALAKSLKSSDGQVIVCLLHEKAVRTRLIEIMLANEKICKITLGNISSAIKTTTTTYAEFKISFFCELSVHLLEKIKQRASNDSMNEIIGNWISRNLSTYPLKKKEYFQQLLDTNILHALLLKSEFSSFRQHPHTELMQAVKFLIVNNQTNLVLKMFAAHAKNKTNLHEDFFLYIATNPQFKLAEPIAEILKREDLLEYAKGKDSGSLCHILAEANMMLPKFKPDSGIQLLLELSAIKAIPPLTYRKLVWSFYFETPIVFDSRGISFDALALIYEYMKSKKYSMPTFSLMYPSLVYKMNSQLAGDRIALFIDFLEKKHASTTLIKDIFEEVDNSFKVLMSKDSSPSNIHKTWWYIGKHIASNSDDLLRKEHIAQVLTLANSQSSQDERNAFLIRMCTFFSVRNALHHLQVKADPECTDIKNSAKFLNLLLEEMNDADIDHLKKNIMTNQSLAESLFNAFSLVYKDAPGFCKVIPTIKDNYVVSNGRFHRLNTV